MLSAAPTLKYAWGPLVMLNAFSLTYFNVDNGSGYFFERIGNVVLAKSDIELQNQAYLMATVMPGLLAGLNDCVLYVRGRATSPTGWRRWACIPRVSRRRSP